MFARSALRSLARVSRGAASMVARRGFASASKTASQKSFAKVAAASVVGVSAAVAAQQWSISSSASAAGNVRLPAEGIPGTRHERTFIAIKPDGVQRNLVGKIIQRFEEKGYKLVAMKLIHPTEGMARGHYDDLKNKPFFGGLVRYFSSGPIIAMVWEGKNAILTGRKMLGETNPLASPPGSIRGDYSIELGRNIIHGSDGPDSAKHEINFWFKGDEVFDWTLATDSWIYE